MLSTVAIHAVRTASAIVTVAAAVMPTRPRTWYEDEGASPDISAAQPTLLTQPLPEGAFGDSYTP